VTPNLDIIKDFSALQQECAELGRSNVELANSNVGLKRQLEKVLTELKNKTTKLGPVACSHYPPAPDRFEMGDNRRFHWREYNGGRYEVYSIGMMQWAECLSEGRAKVVADALEMFYANVASDLSPAQKDATSTQDPQAGD
jgi:hypothetical protein